jgi:ABC-type polysaccharide/polyol phosphate transport system ATPase subunit
MTENAISVRDVSKTFKIYKKPSDRLREAMSFVRKKVYGEEFHALNGITFDVRKGETFGIVGVNGAGKSTLLKIITGITSATTGAVDVEGRVSAMLELGAGFNMQYTGRQNIYLNGVMRGISRDEMDGRMDDILRFADIGDFIDNPVRMYSSGMFARLAFAVAINVDPDILIVDEALAVGDAAFQAKCFSKFEELSRRSVTILFVSHDIGSVKRMCDRAMWLLDGEIRDIGDAARVCNRFSGYMMERRNAELLAQRGEAAEGVWEERGAHDLSTYPPLPVDFDRSGTGDAKVRSVFVTDKNKTIVNRLDAYETYNFHVVAEFFKPTKDAIIGITFENVKALAVFYLNNYREGQSLRVEPGVYEMIFRVTLPGLQKNDYLISPAVAAGDQMTNIKLDWCHNVLPVSVDNPGFNISMIDIEVESVEFAPVEE